ncbi:osmoprotectant uptake system permease [Chromobacterium violaceum]|uniref:ABC transporter permease n=1 Tax=Chromobacterium violaceum TaxID=536 RepID=UPI0009D9561D|nr:ABC transporter permease [Chromobacterium violaceum]OQS10880.1 osmoprotectant uptake system permease [Chromobacterium violaceum]OQS30055.1 osmoprotectant uptake system permease [Chromobacterium violaceum]
MKRRAGLIASALALAALLLALPRSAPLFHDCFPELDRPLYLQDGFGELLLAHLAIVALSGGAAALLGISAALWTSRPAGRDFRPLLETLLSIAQSFPPVAVLALTVPLIGFGAAPALIALALYSLLPITHAALAGLASVPEDALETARGMGMSPRQMLWRVELPLAAPVIVAGLRTAMVINIGTAALASTVGARTLGLPIIVGLSGFNTAYVIQGALPVALLAIVVDQAFQWLGESLTPQHHP